MNVRGGAWQDNFCPDWLRLGWGCFEIRDLYNLVIFPCNRHACFISTSNVYLCTMGRVPTCSYSEIDPQSGFY